MNTVETATVFAALSQPTRLDVLRLLAESGPQGLRAGTISERLGVVASTLSHHLAQLENTRLVRSRRQGRFVFYSIHPDGTRRLLSDLAQICGADDVQQEAAVPLRVAGGA